MIPRLEITFPFHWIGLFFFGKEYSGREDEFLLNHARTGILLALQAAKLSEGSNVGIMAYNCHTVMNAVVQSGCRPVFLDITDDLHLDIEDLKRKAGKMDAIVVTHLFGIKNDVKMIRETFPNLVIIEDCAHAYGLDNYYGDFAVFSIGQGKLPSIGDGGILKVLNPHYIDTVRFVYSSIPDYSVGQRLRLFTRLLVKSLMYNRSIYEWLTLPMKERRKVPSGKETIRPMRMCRGVSAIFLKEKDYVLDKIAWRKNCCSRILNMLPDGVTHYYLGENCFMLVLKCVVPSAVKAYFREQGVETDSHFKYALIWAEEFGYKRGDCPNAEMVCDEILVLPTYSDVSSSL